MEVKGQTSLADLFRSVGSAAISLLVRVSQNMSPEHARLTKFKIYSAKTKSLEIRLFTDF